jgi:hypothetical protein
MRRKRQPKAQLRQPEIALAVGETRTVLPEMYGHHSLNASNSRLVGRNLTKYFDPDYTKKVEKIAVRQVILICELSGNRNNKRLNPKRLWAILTNCYSQN